MDTVLKRHTAVQLHQTIWSGTRLNLRLVWEQPSETPLHTLPVRHHVCALLFCVYRHRLTDTFPGSSLTNFRDSGIMVTLHAL